MVGLNKFSDKERRKQRRSFQSNLIAKDLHTPKYRQRVIPNRKRVDNDDGSHYFIERYYDEEDEDEQRS